MPDLYDGDSDDESSPSEADNKSTDHDDNDGGESDYGTALIPKAILGGKKCKPGEKLTFEVVHVYGDEVEVKFVKYNKDKDKDEDKKDKDDDSDQMNESMDSLEESFA